VLSGEGGEVTQAYPLQWPAGVPRTPPGKRSQSLFTTTLKAATEDVLREIRLLGGRLPVISANLELRNDGLPYANQKQPADVGVAVYFQRKGEGLSFACDRWAKVEHNLRAIMKTIEAIRGIERWGSSDLMERAFTAFTALPAPEQWWQVLGVAQSATAAEIDTAYREKARAAHPDTGGSDAAMARLNAARDQGRAAHGRPS
jgi:hypothetical protein